MFRRKEKIKQLNWLRNLAIKISKNLREWKYNTDVLKPAYKVSESFVKLIVADDEKKILDCKADFVLAMDELHLGHFVEKWVHKQDVEELREKLEERYAELGRKYGHDKNFVARFWHDRRFRFLLKSFFTVFAIHIGVGYFTMGCDDPDWFTKMLSIGHDSAAMKLFLFSIFSAAGYRVGKLGALFAKDHPKKAKLIYEKFGPRTGKIVLGLVGATLFAALWQMGIEARSAIDFPGAGSPEPILAGLSVFAAPAFEKIAGKLLNNRNP